MHNLLFCVHTLCMNYETNTLLQASSSVRSKQQLCFMHGQGQKSERKPTTKSFDEFHNRSPLLTLQKHARKELKDSPNGYKCLGHSVVGIFSLFISHVIKTKNRNRSINKFKDLGYDR